MPRTCSAPYVVAVIAGSLLAFAAMGAAVAAHLFNRISSDGSQA